MAQPKTIHDFYGFPDELFAVRVPGARQPRARRRDRRASCKPTWVGLDLDSWGIDHGTWSVLVHAFPEADIPVVQLSINALEAARVPRRPRCRSCADCARSGVLIVASGNVVHNLGILDWNQPDAGFDWAQRLRRDGRGADDRATRATSPACDEHAATTTWPCPTPDHFLPLLYLAGLATRRHGPPRCSSTATRIGSLSMTSYALAAPA